ncbi:uncharacterized protein flap isoform X4 [Drosophila tropicalis]|uniref:uncharacterized protein flap isoform X4 n=1 Tax=Drosophila tropicalis TaxID=46794 RepID=UPI0035ABDD4A
MEIHSRMQRNCCKFFALILLLLNLNSHMAYGRPDVRQSPFALELQPPLVDTPDQTADFNERAVDSYGNPIDSLHPIDTPDGRKVVSAQGLQFEIPTYASGITEIRKPADDLLPPHIARFDTAVSHQPTEPPRPATDESFPPFNTGNSDANHKVEYTKSDEGKVISTPVIGNQRKETPAPGLAAQPAVNPGKYTGGFGAPAGLLRPQVASKPDIYVAGDQHEFSNNVKGTKARPTSNPGRYNGGFGAPSGVLSPHSSEPPRPFQPQQRQHQPELVAAASSHSTTSRFGGPPGILVPFDNVQRSEGQ